MLAAPWVNTWSDAAEQAVPATAAHRDVQGGWGRDLRRERAPQLVPAAAAAAGHRRHRAGRRGALNQPPGQLPRLTNRNNNSKHFKNK